MLKLGKILYWELLHVGPMSFSQVIILNKIPRTCSKLSLCICYHSPKISGFSRDTCLFLWENGIQISLSQLFLLRPLPHRTVWSFSFCILPYFLPFSLSFYQNACHIPDKCSVINKFYSSKYRCRKHHQDG